MVKSSLNKIFLYFVKCIGNICDDDNNNNYYDNYINNNYYYINNNYDYNNNYNENNIRNLLVLLKDTIKLINKNINNENNKYELIKSFANFITLCFKIPYFILLYIKNIILNISKIQTKIIEKIEKNTNTLIKIYSAQA